MKFKKIRKVFRIFFPKKFSSTELFEHQLHHNREIVSFIKEHDSYLVKLKNTLTIKMRNENHSDYMVLQQVFNLKQYEIITSLIKSNQKTNDKNVIIDAGANVAYTSLYFSNSLSRVSVYAVEPSFENAAMCNENISLNMLDNKIHFYHRALSHKSGLKFQLNTKFRDAKDWAIMTKQDVNGKVEGITIGEIISENNLSYITLIKIDIEGAERFIFDNDSDLSFLKITKLIAIEIHDEFNIREKIYVILKEYGYYLFETGELTVGVNKNLLAK
ncbi:FkbM family methyltransferase [uncultured Algibacter sp.]|uniref:FkbM family methyltransferase n=1 Tax=uncultured Algibacter sp. TaxID=298659 RepID=UPI00261FDC9E|nr:FkbM family methyltransferase [uncultured Algibacter sp.]